jgi:hypothetical protein
VLAARRRERAATGGYGFAGLAGFAGFAGFLAGSGSGFSRSLMGVKIAAYL